MPCHCFHIIAFASQRRRSPSPPLPSVIGTNKGSTPLGDFNLLTLLCPWDRESKPWYQRNQDIVLIIEKFLLPSLFLASSTSRLPCFSVYVFLSKSCFFRLGRARWKRNNEWKKKTMAAQNSPCRWCPRLRSLVLYGSPSLKMLTLLRRY